MPKPFRFQSSTAVALFAALSAFMAYTMIFGFRKTFTVATFEGISYWGFSLKTLMVISQVLGYLLAKFYGIRYISALNRNRRGRTIIMLTGISWAAWLGFGLVPSPFNLVFLFLNGFPLGMLWGVVFSYVEGRRATDFIGAALAVSFIFSSGFVKSVGGALLIAGVSETWVPFVAGGIFAVPLLFFIWLLEKIPPPNDADVEERMVRKPMLKKDRAAILRQLMPGIILSIIIYTLATIFRDIRDNFSADMWQEMGFANKPAIFTQTELPVTLFILILIGSLSLIRNNKLAFQISLLFIGLGFLVTGLSSFLFQQGSLSPFIWMTASGIGLYMVYIPFNSMYFDRMIATYRMAGNVGFLIYLADSFGYLGSVSVLFSKEFFRIQTQWVPFFAQSTIWLSAAGIILTVGAALYFATKRLEQS